MRKSLGKHLDSTARSRLAAMAGTRLAPAADAVPEASSAPPAPRLPPHPFTNVGQPAHPPTPHSAVLLLDAVNGWFDNFAPARAAVLGMLNKVPVDEEIALYVVAKHRGLMVFQDYTLDRSLPRAALDKYVPEWTCPAPPGPDYWDERRHQAAGPGPAAVKFTACRDLQAMHPDVESPRHSFDALAASWRSQPGRKSVFWVTQGDGTRGS